ncbi:cell cycle regulator of non-homologous end joining isoform X2 [Cololabis saira]|uniref:cell cycle regulator of non-homologous end joining isoform X2 n=1 Tax=Cololabis saira TaxID=129043 RepID=UPI002AD4DA25|nr:cell cycle regulator of non-homologous end joining isoform X2 [Cololabis saira]
MSERHRALPSWMETNKKEGEVKETPHLRTQRKRKAARSAFYCMNEAELVEAAVSFLTNAGGEDAVLPTHRQDGNQINSTTKKKEKPAISQNLDITELETLPYTKSPQHTGPDGKRSGQAQNNRGLKNVDVEAEGGKLPTPADPAAEDDALQLVRDIFFT